MAPNISQRKFIKWGDEPAHEDTTTTVLTSDRGFYVDIRLATDPSLTQKQKLQWAFAGTSESSINQDGSRHTTWHHFVDNKSRNPENDSGDMWEQEDGDTLEKGEMAHPVTGKITPYQELWTDLEIDGPYAGLNEARKVCVVLKLERPEDEAWGMMARIGGRIQGVVRVGDKIDYGIWVYDGKWKKTESFAKASPLSVASALFEIGKIPDEKEFVEGGSSGNDEAEGPEILCLKSNRVWQVVEKTLIGS